jgi:asparagine synthetase B (glutamine-hydrolysing)
MCGIFGFTLDINNAEVSLKKMGEAMIHRGPDGEGYYVEKV